MPAQEVKIVEGYFLSSASSEFANFTLATLKQENAMLREQAVNILLEIAEMAALLETAPNIL